MEKTLMEQAINYVEHGFYIFPCREKYDGKVYNRRTGKWEDKNEKAPVGDLVFKGVKNASNDIDTIKMWWTKRPNAAIGCDLGRSGLFVVDLDNHKEGVNGIDNWHKLGINDSGCGHVITASKGLHIYFLDKNNYGKHR